MFDLDSVSFLQTVNGSGFTYRPETFLPKRPVDLGRKPHEVDKPKHFKLK